MNPFDMLLPYKSAEALCCRCSEWHGLIVAGMGQPWCQMAKLAISKASLCIFKLWISWICFMCCFPWWHPHECFRGCILINRLKLQEGASVCESSWMLWIGCFVINLLKLYAVGEAAFLLQQNGRQYGPIVAGMGQPWCQMAKMVMSKASLCILKLWIS